MFHVGQKVVCIVERPWCERGHPTVSSNGHLPRYGDIVTVSRIVESPAGWNCSVIGLIEFPPDLFQSDRFRPLIERKTDISVFTALLNPSIGRVLTAEEVDQNFHSFDAKIRAL